MPLEQFCIHGKQRCGGGSSQLRSIALYFEGFHILPVLFNPKNSFVGEAHAHGLDK
jgi:hypothetical protein